MKSRTLAARLVEAGGVRLTRAEVTVRVDKASRTVMVGDHLVFARSGRLFTLEVLDVGEGRRSAPAAQALYRTLIAPEAEAFEPSAPNSR